MTAVKARILELYRAFNGRDLDGFLRMLAPQIDWTNELDDSRVIGKDALRAHMLDQAATRYTPIHVTLLNDGRVAVLVQRAIGSGAAGFDTRARHTFQLENDLVVRMDSQPKLGPVEDEALEPLLVALFDALDRQDIDATMATFHPQAHMPDGLEDTSLSGLAEIRAYYLRQFATVRIDYALMSTRHLADDSLEALVHVLVRGLGGGFWWEGPVTVLCQIKDGLIIEMGAANVAMAGG